MEFYIDFLLSELTCRYATDLMAPSVQEPKLNCCELAASESNMHPKMVGVKASKRGEIKK